MAADALNRDLETTITSPARCLDQTAPLKLVQYVACALARPVAIRLDQRHEVIDQLFSEGLSRHATESISGDLQWADPADNRGDRADVLAEVGPVQESEEQ